MKRRSVFSTIRYFSRNVMAVFAVVLIWRGIWYLLDLADIFLFGGSHMWTALAGVGAGLLILYLPDKDLKEIERP